MTWFDITAAFFKSLYCKTPLRDLPKILKLHLMNDIDWSTLFTSRTREEWVQKINADHKGNFQQNDLIQPVGEGVFSHAVLTSEDIIELPHLVSPSHPPEIHWNQTPGWRICVPLLLAGSLSECIQRAKKAQELGAESFLILDIGPSFFGNRNQCIYYSVQK